MKPETLSRSYARMYAEARHERAVAIQQRWADTAISLQIYIYSLRRAWAHARKAA